MHLNRMTFCFFLINAVLAKEDNDLFENMDYIRD